MDPIKASLKGKGRNTSVSPVVRTSQPVVIPQPQEDMPLSDKLLVRYFLTHFEEEKVKSYLGNPSRNLRKILLLADIYAAEHGEKELDRYLGDAINANSWAAFLALTSRDRLYNLMNRIYREPETVRKNIQQQLAEDAIYQFIELDFTGYRERTKLSEQNLILLCDSILRIPPTHRNIYDLRKQVKEKTNRLAQIVASYNIDLRKEGLHSLYLLDGVRELK